MILALPGLAVVKVRCSSVRLAVRFAYEWQNDAGEWFRSYGNENWECNVQGFMMRRFAGINDLPIAAAERKFLWPRPPSGQ